MSINIRRAKDSDIVFIKKNSKETAWKSISEYQRKTLNKEEWSQHMDELFGRIFKRDSHEIFVAEDETSSFLGYVWVGEGMNMMTGTKHGYIYDMFVKENHRRKGIGMMLMKRAEHYCREKGYKEMLLMVSTNNQPARKLYIKQGFKVEQMYMGKRLT